MMKTLLLVACLGAVGVFGGWVDICKQSSHCPTILMGVSCKDATMCAVVGGYSNTPMGVYYSKDQFATFQRANMEGDSMMIMDIAIDKQGYGATAGMGLLNNTAILYTTDCVDWKDSADISFMVGQDMNAFGNGEFGYVGTTSTVFNTEGALISADHGKDWTPGNWPKDLCNYTQARYGSFPSPQVLYISGGQWPSKNKYRMDECLQISARSCIKVPKATPSQYEAWNRRRRPQANTGYNSILTKSEDGGKTWETQFKGGAKDGFYFNDVNCFDTTHCFAVGEGFTDGPAPGARIYGTTDGKTWKRVFFSTATGASMMRVHMVSNTEAWAAGGEVVSGTAYGTFYHTTDGGKTWNLESKVPFVGDVMGMHFTSTDLGFAVGVTEFQTSVIMKYTK